MKKLLACLIASSLLLCGCVAEKEENFEEIEKIDLEVSDYVAKEEVEKEVEAEIPAEETEVVETQVESADTKTENKSEKSEDNKKIEQKTQKVETPKQDTKVETKTPEKTPETIKEPAPDVVKVNYNEMNLSGKTICIDAAHGIFTQNKDEGIAPGVNVIKAGYKEGTKGAGVSEDEITLAVATVLKQKLEAKGATVLMTRTDENATLSNVERAEFANNNGADICIKLHADANQEGGSGMTMLVPGNKYIKDSNLISKSKLLGKTVLNGAVAKTGAIKRGVYTTSEMSGFNWSKIPVVLLEMGFLTNPQDEAKLSDVNYQNLIADGIVEGILEYYK